MSKKTVQIYADGACLGNPGPGGWAAIMLYGGHRKELVGSESAETTNNRMELIAVIEGLKAIKRTDVHVEVFTDSKYVRDGISKWIKKWKATNWRRSGGGSVKNRELWEELDAIQQKLKVKFNWVPGHSGIPENERADFLSNKAAHDARTAVF